MSSPQLFVMLLRTGPIFLLRRPVMVKRSTYFLLSITGRNGFEVKVTNECLELV